MRGRPAFLLSCFLLVVASRADAQLTKLLVPLDDLERRATADSIDAPAHYNLIAIEPHTAVAYLALSYLPYARRARLWEEEEKGKVPAGWQPVLEEAWRFRRLVFLLDPLVDLKPLALMIPPVSTLDVRGSEEAFYTDLLNGFGSVWDGQYGRAYQFLHEIAGNVNEDLRKKFPSWFLWYEGLAAAHTNDFARAESDFRLLLERAETQARQDGGATLAFTSATHYRYALAVMLDLAGRSREAVPLLQQALTEDAGLFEAHVRLATIFEDQHRPVAALEERRRALAANPEDATLAFELGEALARAGELPEARTMLRQASETNPRNLRALYVLGFVATQLGSAEEARTAYARFLALAPSVFSTQKVEAQKRLLALR